MPGSTSIADAILFLFFISQIPNGYSENKERDLLLDMKSNLEGLGQQYSRQGFRLCYFCRQEEVGWSEWG
jgi:hypothetical protein